MDIRSYFQPKGSTSNAKTKSNSNGPIKQSGQKKRAVVIIDSDSDEESVSIPHKRSKAGNTPTPDSNKKQEKRKKSESPNKTSKYFKAETVNVSDIFGSKPIKRDVSRNIIKKTVIKEKKEFHIDEDFEAELLQLDIDASEVEVVDKSKQSPDKHELNREQILNDAFGPRKAVDNKVKTTKNATSSKQISSHKDDHWQNKKSKITDQNSPEKPSKASSSKKPSRASSPDKPSTTSSPDKPSITSSPDKPTITSSPDKPSTTSSPDKPSTTSSPDKPTITSSPAKPSITSSPDKPSPSKVTSCTSSSPKTSSKLPISENPLSKVSTTNKSEKLDNKTSNDTRKQKSSENADSKEVSPSRPKRVDLKTKEKLPFLKKADEALINGSTPANSKVKDTTKALLTESYHLWVEKHKPTSTKQIIGQQGDRSCVNKLMYWLKNWQRNQSGNKKLVKPSPWAKNDDGAYFKAALLSGPPGVGKTTTAHLVAKELGFDVVEFNASDTRSKKLLHQEVSELLTTNSLSPFFSAGTGEDKSAGKVTAKHVLLMDEVDGMAGNEDRGGVQELIQLIKQSRVPVVCMCNDRNHPKIRSLANYCFDLRFSKPRLEQIRGAMLTMCFKENLKLAPDVLTDIISSANQDIRLIINHLSMLSIEKSKLANSTKYVKMGPWDITKKVFSEEDHKTMSFSDKSDLFFHDYNIVPLFVQDNYLNVVPHKPDAKNKIKKMELYAAAAKSISLGDLTEKRIRTNNAWGLLPVQAIFSSVVPGEILEGHIGAQINFPAWFGKNSRQTKMSRLAQELTVHSRLRISGNKEAMLLDYAGPLERNVAWPLASDGVDGVTRAVEVMAEYCLVREDLESLAELSTWPNTRNLFSDVDSKVKAAFTRAYNKSAAPTPYAAVSIKKGSRGAADAVDVMDTIPEDEGEEGVQEDEEEKDDLEVDAMITVKKKQPNKKAEVKAPSTSKGGKNVKRGGKK